MKKPNPDNGAGMNIFKRSLPLIATGSFFMAAFILSAVVWNPAIAETPNGEGSDTSLLLTLDKPVPPVSRAIAIDEDTDEAVVTNPELVTELNTWTFTNHPGPNHHPHHGGGGGGNGHHHPHHPHHHHPPHPHHHHPSGFH